MTLEPSVSPGVRRIDTAPPGALDMRLTEKSVHQIMSPLIDTDAWIVTGQTATGCYGEVQP